MPSLKVPASGLAGIASAECAGAAAVIPTASDRIAMAAARLVGEPDLYGVGSDAFFAPDLFQARGKTFSKSSIAPSA